MASGIRKGVTGIITRQPAGQVVWHSRREAGYKIRCLDPLKRFRGIEIPWDDDKHLAATTEFIAKSSRSRKVVKLSAGQYGTPIEIYVKRYNFKTWIAPYLRMLRKTRAREEFDLGWKLMDAGIRTPRPVWMAEATGAPSRYSLLATEALPESENVVERWRRLTQEADRVDLLQAMGKFLLSLHEHGFYHDDCKANHVQVLPDAPSTPSEFFIIDLLGCSTSIKLTRYRRAKNLFQVLRSFYPPKKNYGFSSTHRAVLLEAYGGSLAEAAKWEQMVFKIGAKKGRALE